MLILFLIGFSLGDSLYKSGYTELAVTEYKREFHFMPESYSHQEKRARYVLALLRTEKSEKIEEVARLSSDYPELDREFVTEIGWQLIDLGYYSQAIDFLSTTKEKRLLGFAHLMSGNLLRAREIFQSSGEDELSRETADFLVQPRKSVTKAILLSTFCPGAGEIYAGNAGRGIIDFILSWGSGYLLYDAFHDKRYVDAGLVFSFLINRFWTGSIYNAGRLAAEKNEATRQKWLDSIRREYLEPAP